MVVVMSSWKWWFKAWIIKGGKYNMHCYPVLIFTFHTSLSFTHLTYTQTDLLTAYLFIIKLLNLCLALARVSTISHSHHQRHSPHSPSSQQVPPFIFSLNMFLATSCYRSYTDFLQISNHSTSLFVLSVLSPNSVNGNYNDFTSPTFPELLQQRKRHLRHHFTT